MTGPEGDMTAARIELYLKESGDELMRAEAYENLTRRTGIEVAHIPYRGAAPAMTDPTSIQIKPGIKPNRAARTGPTRGPAPAIAAKWWPKTTHLLVGT